MGQTRVDLLHLLEDLRDAYPGGLEETILSEVVANALDSGAARISVRTDAGEALLVVVDDGQGMRRRELARYHDIAASTKVRGQGIGFAGVGIKLGLLASEEVLTETRRPEGHVATRWRLAGRQKAPWRWVDPPGLVEERVAGARERDAVLGAVEQPDAQLLLELAYLFADCGLRIRARLSSASTAARSLASGAGARARRRGSPCACRGRRSRSRWDMCGAWRPRCRRTTAASRSARWAR